MSPEVTVSHRLAAKDGKRRRVVFVGEYVMPEGTPAALRATGLARALSEAGYDCQIGAAEIGEGGRWLPRGAVRTFHGLGVTSMAEYGGPRSTKLARAIGGLANYGAATARWLGGMSTTDVAAVVAMGGYTPLALRLLRWRGTTGVPLIVDIVDWYDPWHCIGGPFGPFRLQVEFALRVLYKHANGVIAVSSWLERYYTGAGRRSVRVPPTVDPDEPKWVRARERRDHASPELNLCYAGTPGKKDDVPMVVEGISRARSCGADARLMLVGPSADEIAFRLGDKRYLLAELGSAIRFLNRQPHAELPGLIATADFTVLMRPDKRYANAGFPTKLVESLASGVPVIANETSDIGWAVRDGREWLRVDDYSADSLAAAIMRAAAFDPGQRSAMRVAAEARVREVFDFRGYATPLAEFVEAVGS